MRSPHRPGLLLAMEGIDGAGKTTQIRALESLLRQAEVPHVATKEPTNGPWGRRIRESARTARMAPNDELEAFLRDRREHVTDLLTPSLQAGKVVLVDRYYFSTVAYQGARGLDPKDLLARNAFAPEPDLLIVLDLPPKKASAASAPAATSPTSSSKKKSSVAPAPSSAPSSSPISTSSTPPPRRPPSPPKSPTSSSPPSASPPPKPRSET